ncbi:MAG: GntR family transcriptional regulator [Actinomycetota bacterium]
MSRPLSVDDVQRLLIERIRSGEFQVGSRLPSVRSMADEFHSNPSTVDRALHRLAQAGIVRTVPRQGTYVAALETPLMPSGRSGDAESLKKVLMGLRTSGMSRVQARDLVDEKLDEVFADPKVVFMECNTIDLEHMAQMITNATGVDLIPLLLDDLPESSEEQFDVIAVPLFHIADLKDRVQDYSKVVELNFHPSPQGLRRLATLDPSTRVVVSAPTDRGMERMLSLTRQFFPGEVATHHSLNDDPEALTEYDAVVYTNAAQLEPDVLDRVPHPILIEWELDPASSATFLARVGQAANGD